ncbi:hypothetical protein ISN45_At03g026510 [Arabidopsis thaliana x Arabidopsis arenosa]|uniref:Uncharacterized protein n=2 Tax=Arabidopsis TaxID=3701 RepID=A0A8T2F8G5_ARASU|nr:hypothetical protein ISN45_At03g026510 [Arabidopsis thaliana x Arabidopsis arenosa]KAG7632488.1 hypothetical protein ISN44_As03g026190 [Arabidopsis suecica]
MALNLKMRERGKGSDVTHHMRRSESRPCPLFNLLI